MKSAKNPEYLQCNEHSVRRSYLNNTVTKVTFKVFNTKLAMILFSKTAASHRITYGLQSLVTHQKIIQNWKLISIAR